MSFYCHDCGWVGDEPDEAENASGYGSEPSWVEVSCPECGENVAPVAATIRELVTELFKLRVQVDDRDQDVRILTAQRGTLLGILANIRDETEEGDPCLTCIQDEAKRGIALIGDDVGRSARSDHGSGR